MAMGQGADTDYAIISSKQLFALNRPKIIFDFKFKIIKKL